MTKTDQGGISNDQHSSVIDEALGILSDSRKRTASNVQVFSQRIAVHCEGMTAREKLQFMREMHDKVTAQNQEDRDTHLIDNLNRQIQELELQVGHFAGKKSKSDPDDDSLSAVQVSEQLFAAIKHRPSKIKWISKWSRRKAHAILSPIWNWCVKAVKGTGNVLWKILCFIPYLFHVLIITVVSYWVTAMHFSDVYILFIIASSLVFLFTIVLGGEISANSETMRGYGLFFRWSGGIMLALFMVLCAFPAVNLIDGKDDYIGIVTQKQSDGTAPIVRILNTREDKIVGYKMAWYALIAPSRSEFSWQPLPVVPEIDGVAVTGIKSASEPNTAIDIQVWYGQKFNAKGMVPGMTTVDITLDNLKNTLNTALRKLPQPITPAAVRDAVLAVDRGNPCYSLDPKEINVKVTKIVSTTEQWKVEPAETN